MAPTAESSPIRCRMRAGSSSPTVSLSECFRVVLHEAGKTTRFASPR